MTESNETNNSLHQAMAPINEPYEQLQDSVEDNETRASWRDHDRRRLALTQTYHDLKEDPRYADSHKQEQMWQSYVREAPRIKAAAEKTKSLLEKEVRYAEEQSIPRPRGESLKMGTPERLLAAQNAASSLIRKVERSQKRLEKSPIGGPTTPTILKDEFAKGLAQGGLEGATHCSAVLLAAEELDVDQDSFLNDLREPKHHEALDRARRYTTMTQAISASVPEPPVARPGSSRGSSNRNVFLRESSQGAPIRHAGGSFGRRRKPSWK